MLPSNQLSEHILGSQSESMQIWYLTKINWQLI